MKVKIICRNCKKEFSVRPSKSNRKYCSTKCYREYIKHFKVCEYCDKEFYARPKDRKFCSRGCFNEHRKGENHPKYKEKIIKICENCNKEFEIHECRKDSKYCSVKCATKIIAKNKIKRTTLICLNCNKEYKVINKRVKESLFCSRKCKDNYQKQSLKDERNSNFGNYKYTEEQYEEWKKYRQAVRNKSYRVYRKFKNIINPFNLKLSRWTYHLDHKYSIHDGFHNEVPVSIISSLKNLQILPYKENLRKRTKSEIKLNELMI